MKYIVRPYRRGEEQYVADAHCRLNTAGGRLLRSMPRRSPWSLPARSSRLIGSVMLCQSGEAGEGQVRLFLVEPDYRRCGVGSALMKVVLDGAKEMGYTRLMLWSAEPLTDAIRLYERAGFHITERVKNTEWRPDGDLVYEIKMVKECL
ncbi:GNAT family N-acetyltransferase [Megasphaera stantonii]|uniref:GNAT family N-acetyltransferase n=1 Tax=Megasphaera stantonii TaxID=2144175 RepID=UPI00320A32CA